MKKHLIISTVGTSLLTNNAEKEQRTILLNNSNCKKKDCDTELKSIVENLSIKAEKNLETNDQILLKKTCAELNGLYSIYEFNSISASDVFHVLIATDTYQGTTTSQILERHLQKDSAGTLTYIPSNLNTLSKFTFNDGIKDLLKWCDENLPGYKDSGYEIIFNLTGSFKVLQGYLSTIGMFYADKISYIFDGEQTSLIEIPKLPVKINKDIMAEHITEFLLMKAGANLNKKDIEGIHTALIDSIDGVYFLSVWGELLWDRSKEELLKKEIPELPFIKYENSFIKDLKKKLDMKYKVRLFETLARVSLMISENNGKINSLKEDGGLQYDNYSNKSDSGDPIGHFRLDQGDRISCIHKNNKLYLRHFGSHDYVNNNP